MVLKSKEFDLINASFALPFVKPEEFQRTWKRILRMLKRDGIVCVNLFGNRDSWAPKFSHITFLKRGDARKLFKGLKVISFKEREYDAKPAIGAEKHWHTFEVIAQRTKSS